MRNVPGPTAFALLLLALLPSCVQPFPSKRSAAESAAAESAASKYPSSNSFAARSGQEPQPAGEPAGSAWSFGAEVYTYFAPDDHDYLQPTVTADRDQLHLEARWNYEALDTGSLWAGWNFEGGGEIAWEITPMLGAVVGEVTGIAPGYKGSLSWWLLELYGEGEYVFDTGDSDDSFFYNWSTLTIAPADWVRLGIVTQRTRVYDTDHSLQRGFLVGVTLGRFDVTAHVFNPDDSQPTTVVSAALGF